jgi:hypothetical protein
MSLKGEEIRFPGKEGRTVRCRWLVAVLATGYLLLSCAGVLAMEATFEVAGGYDDNATEVPDGEGSAMARYLARLWLPVLAESNGTGVDVYLEGRYCQYFSLDDNQQLRTGTELSLAPWKNRLRVGLFAEVSMYRDNLVAEDEYNTLIVGGDLQWLADAQLAFSFQQTFSKVDYQNQVSLPGQRGYAVGRGRGMGSGGQGQPVIDERTTLSRNDTLWTSEMMATYVLSPNIDVDLSVLYCSSDSSNNYESNVELGGYSQVIWYYSEFMEFYASGYWSKLDYEDAPAEDERRDDVYGFTLGASRFVGALELSARFDRTVNDSSIAGENYRKSVVLCGVSYTF